MDDAKLEPTVSGEVAKLLRLLRVVLTVALVLAGLWVLAWMGST